MARSSGARFGCSRLDPAQQPLLDQIAANTDLRLTGANENGWFGVGP